jgi:hypothetical protein
MADMQGAGDFEGGACEAGRIRSHPAGIIAMLALRARQAPRGRLFRPEGRTWSADPRGTNEVKRVGIPARRVRDV